MAQPAGHVDGAIFKGLTMHGIYGRKMYETWYKMTQLVLSGFPLHKVLTHQIHIDDFQKGFDLMDSGNCGKAVDCRPACRNLYRSGTAGWKRGLGVWGKLPEM